jgi:hypothetical protein
MKKNNNATRLATGCGIMVIIYLLAFMLIGLAGCSSLEKLWTDQISDSTAGRVITIDSSGTKSTNEKYIKETTTIYKDTTIFIEGKPYPIFFPQQTSTREQGQKEVEETAQKSGSDSGWVKVIEALQIRQKEKTGIPFTTILIFGLLAIVGMGIVGIIIYLKVKP